MFIDFVWPSSCLPPSTYFGIGMRNLLDQLYKKWEVSTSIVVHSKRIRIVWICYKTQTIEPKRNLGSLVLVTLIGPKRLHIYAQIYVSNILSVHYSPARLFWRTQWNKVPTENKVWIHQFKSKFAITVKWQWEECSLNLSFLGIQLTIINHGGFGFPLNLPPLYISF